MYEAYVRIRDQAGARDSQVAKATGISQSVFSDWKKGRSKPKADKLIKIAKFFNVHVEDLLEVQA